MCITPVTLADETHKIKGFQERTKDHTKQTDSDMDPLPSHPVADLGWSNVGFGLTFIALNSIISHMLHLRIGASLMLAALRCVVQLTLVATILQHVFAAENIWAVVCIACKYVLVCAWRYLD